MDGKRAYSTGKKSDTAIEVGRNLKTGDEVSKSMKVTKVYDSVNEKN